MPGETPFWIQVAGIVVALSGWGKVLYDYQATKPKIRGRILNVIRGQFAHPDEPGGMLSSFLTYLYLVNTRHNAVHMLDFQMEVRQRGKWRRLERVYGFHNVQHPEFRASDGSLISIPNLSENFIYRKNAPVDYGKPLHGWVMFAGASELYGVKIEAYRTTCIDVYRNRHAFTTSTDKFENLYLFQELAGLSLPKSMRVHSTSSTSAPG